MTTKWAASGEYMEACSCNFLCPCIPKNMTQPATHDFCKVALSFEIIKGHFGDLSLDQVRWIFVAQSKALMSDGEWIGGLIVDSSATEQQASAIAAICQPGAGEGPSALAPLISDFRGIERHPIDFVKEGGTVSVKVDGAIEQVVEGVASLSKEGEYVTIDNVFHPSNSRLSLASALKNFIKVFGIDWEDNSGTNNGHFAPFAWQGEIT